MKTVIKAVAAALCLLAVLCTLVFAQAEKQKVAVYMAGPEPKGALGSHRMVGGELVKLLSQSREYSAVDRTEAILAQLAKEHKYQRGGAVSDAQIKALGEQLGVQFLCIVDIGDVKGGYYLEVKMVDVVSAVVVKSATADSDLKDRSEMMRVAQALARELVGGVAAQTQQQVAPVQQTAPQQQAAPVQQTTPRPQTTTTQASGSFVGGNNFTDPRDGKTYRTVRIGNRTWMAENLNYQTGNSWCYDNNQSNCQKYGRLYDWNTARTACPAGWRLATRQDWDDLGQAVGGRRRPTTDNSIIHWGNAGEKLKSRSGWSNTSSGGNGNGTDDFGFSALPGGLRNIGGSFGLAGTDGYWWSAAGDGSDEAYYRNMCRDHDYMFEHRYTKSYGYSARCARD